MPHPDPVEARVELVDAARRAFDWIGSVAVDVDSSLGWLEGGVLVDDLYSGTAGILAGCAEAAAAGLGTAQVSAGARARQGAAGIAGWLAGQAPRPSRRSARPGQARPIMALRPRHWPIKSQIYNTMIFKVA
jgi:hypothetical protein